MAKIDPRLAALGFSPAPEAGQAYREQRLRELGITDADENLAAPWIPVKSSNVYAIRWVGGSSGLQVWFQNAAKTGPGPVYAYAASESDYDDLFSARSKGGWVYACLKKPGIPYRKIG